MDPATLHLILTQQHLTIQQMDIQIVPQIVDWEVRHSLGVRNLIGDALSR
jgi:hypothetical protein